MLHDPSWLAVCVVCVSAVGLNWGESDAAVYRGEVGGGMAQDGLLALPPELDVGAVYTITTTVADAQATVPRPLAPRKRLR